MEGFLNLKWKRWQRLVHSVLLCELSLTLPFLSAFPFTQGFTHQNHRHGPYFLPGLFFRHWEFDRHEWHPECTHVYSITLCNYPNFDLHILQVCKPQPSLQTFIKAFIRRLLGLLSMHSSVKKILQKECGKQKEEDRHCKNAGIIGPFHVWCLSILFDICIVLENHTKSLIFQHLHFILNAENQIRLFCVIFKSVLWWLTSVPDRYFVFTLYLYFCTDSWWENLPMESYRRSWPQPWAL